jgi:hypothetical protein
MAPFVSSTIVAVVSAIVAVVSLLLALHSARRSDKDSARAEALALAETRKQLIAELRATLEEERTETRVNLIVLRHYLERSPPDVDVALLRIARLLDDESRSRH